MSYVMPPNNAIAAIASPNLPVEQQKAIFDLGVKHELRDISNTPEGSGVVPGWGGRCGGRK